MSQNVIVTDDQGFDSTVLQSPEPVLVDFWAPWCGPCRLVGPIVEELAGQYSGRLRTVKIDIDESPEVASRYGVQSIPTLMFFKGGQEVRREIGALPKARLASAIESVVEPAQAKA